MVIPLTESIYGQLQTDVITYRHKPPCFVGKSFSYQFSDPVSFCTDLSRSTTENLEVRICRNRVRDHEDVEVELIQLCILDE